MYTKVYEFAHQHQTAKAISAARVNPKPYVAPRIPVSLRAPDVFPPLTWTDSIALTVGTGAVGVTVADPAAEPDPVMVLLL